MKILRKLEVPTGHILTILGEKGQLELMSIGDYGQDHNLKWNEGGLTREINSVPHKELLPLEKKWVITISTQYGCSMDCTFCDVPKVGPGKNATLQDLLNELEIGMSIHPEVQHSERLNIHFARMGEPTWNTNVLEASRLYKTYYDSKFHLHPVISTMMPKKNRFLDEFLQDWIYIKNEIYNGNAGLQLSINSTEDSEREKMFSGNSSTLEQISKLTKDLRPKGRKITLNFPVCKQYTINAEKLADLFDPQYFITKLTPMHETKTAIANNIETQADYGVTYTPYKQHEDNLRKAGFEVLVFIASVEEDLGLITCGNAILSGRLPEVPYKELEV